MKVDCPDPDCPGYLQPPFYPPGHDKLYPPQCHTCRVKYPDLTDYFQSSPVQEGSREPRQKPEEKLRRACNDTWKLLGFLVYDLEQGYRWGGTTRVTAGIADVLLLGHGLHVWIEYKATTPQSEAQEFFEDSVKRNGGYYYVQRKVADVKRILEELKEDPRWQS